MSPYLLMSPPCWDLFAVKNRLLEEEEKACLVGKDGIREAARLYKALRVRLSQTPDRERVGLWSKGGVEELCQVQEARGPESMDVD